MNSEDANNSMPHVMQHSNEAPRQGLAQCTSLAEMAHCHPGGYWLPPSPPAGLPIEMMSPGNRASPGSSSHLPHLADSNDKRMHSH
jgi:hypothetical protein